MKKLFIYLITIISVFSFNSIVKADTYINLNDLTSSTNNTNYSSIKSYDTLDNFLIDYKSGKLPDAYITNFLYDGVSTVKTPDLDDFIEEDSNDVKIKTLSIK